MPAMKIDLHCHSSCSDGTLRFEELLSKALDLDIECLAVTDHDTIQGYADKNTYPGLDLGNSEEVSLKLHTGVEISTQWHGHDIHIVGLDFDPKNECLKDTLQEQDKKRESRSELIAAKLEKKGFKGALERARAIAGKAQIARPHFAEFLVQEGHVSDYKQAFDRYLAQGKPCYQSTDWPDIAEAIAVIKEASGIAVMAHPTRYKMTATKLRRMVAYFVESGGQALEFVGGSGFQDAQAFIKELCLEHHLMGSPASDFHSESQVWQKLGQTGQIPKDVKGVWEDFGEPFAALAKPAAL